MELARTHGIVMPIAQEVYDVVQGQADASKAFRGLLRNPAGSEAEPG